MSNQPVDLGTIVLWYPEGDKDSQPYCGVVTNVGQENVCINVLDHTIMNFRIHDGVFHISDERCRREAGKESGGWDYTPQYKRLQAMEKAIASELKKRN